MQNVKFTTKKRMIVAALELNGVEMELGMISFGVSDKTLKSFKEDMEMIALGLSSLNDVTQSEPMPRTSQPTADSNFIATLREISILETVDLRLVNKDGFDFELVGELVCLKFLGNKIWTGQRKDGKNLEFILCLILSDRLGNDLLQKLLDDIQVKWLALWSDKTSTHYRPVRKTTGAESDSNKQSESTSSLLAANQKRCSAEMSNRSLMQHLDPLEGMPLRPASDSTNPLPSVVTRKVADWVGSETSDDKPGNKIAEFKEAYNRLPIAIRSRLFATARTRDAIRLYRTYGNDTCVDLLVVKLNKDDKISRSISTLHRARIEELCGKVSEWLSVSMAYRDDLMCCMVLAIEYLLQGPKPVKGDGATFFNVETFIRSEGIQPKRPSVNAVKPVVTCAAIELTELIKRFTTAYRKLPKWVAAETFDPSNNGVSKISRAYRGATTPDAVVWKIELGIGRKNPIRVAVNGDPEYIAAKLMRSLKYREDLLPHVETIRETMEVAIALLLATTTPSDKGISAQNLDVEALVGGVVNKETIEVTTVVDDELKKEESSKKTVFGFTSTKAIELMDSLHKGNDLATKSWPWFFDSEGRFNYLQFAEVDGKPQIYARNVKNKAGVFQPVNPSYLQIRSLIEVAYLVGTKGTGIENYPEVEAVFKQYVDSFMKAVLIELDVSVVGVPKKIEETSDTTKPYIGYFNFQGETDHDSILNQLTFPSGDLRVVSIKAGEDGINWFVKGNKVGMGPMVVPRRIRYGKVKPEIQINEILNEIIEKTNLPDNLVLRNEIKRILERTAAKVSSGLL